MLRATRVCAAVARGLRAQISADKACAIVEGWYFLAAVIYVGIVERVGCTIIDPAKKKRYILTIGVGTGIICSCIGHGLYMIVLD